MYSNKRLMRALTAAYFVVNLVRMTQIATAASPTDGCALLSKSQVAAALGAEVDDGKHIIGAGDCRWTQQGKLGASVAVLQINLSTAQAFALGKTAIPGWNKVPQAGVGDDAYVADNGKVTFPMSPTLSVKKGAVFLTVAAKVPNASSVQVQAVEKAVAMEILRNL